MEIASKKDNPGVVIPPPIIYIAIFVASLFIQKLFPLDRNFFYSEIAANLGIVLILSAVVFAAPAMIQFIRSKNPIVPVKSASSLQTNGIYSVTRNPMYMGLLLLYIGIGITKGNWWTIFMIPLVILIVQFYAIRREESYLERQFGEEYINYKKKVRRWI